MSLDYNKYLLNHTIAQLKENIIKPYKLHLLFTISGKNKGQLIKDIMEHTELKKKGIYLKKEMIIVNENSKKHKKLINFKYISYTCL